MSCFGTSMASNANRRLGEVPFRGHQRLSSQRAISLEMMPANVDAETFSPQQTPRTPENDNRLILAAIVSLRPGQCQSPVLHNLIRYPVALLPHSTYDHKPYADRRYDNNHTGTCHSYTKRSSWLDERRYAMDVRRTLSTRLLDCQRLNSIFAQ